MFVFSNKITAAACASAVRTDLPEVHGPDDQKVTHDHDYHVPCTDSDLDQLKAAREHIELLDAKIAVLESVRFGLQKISQDPELIRFYTGFKSYTVFHAVYLALEPTAQNMVTWTQIQRRRGDLSNSLRFNALKVEQLPHIDQFFMFLCFVRQGFRGQDLAVRFRVSQATVSRILITWANYLYVLFGTVSIWP